MGVLDYIWLGVSRFSKARSLHRLWHCCLDYVDDGACQGSFSGSLSGRRPVSPARLLWRFHCLFSFRSLAIRLTPYCPSWGFLIGIMKGATIGGAVPAILFNTPGTPDAFMTTLDGYPDGATGSGQESIARGTLLVRVGRYILRSSCFCLRALPCHSWSRPIWTCPKNRSSHSVAQLYCRCDRRLARQGTDLDRAWDCLRSTSARERIFTPD